MTDTSYIIALGGGSGSGKSTLADALIQKFGPKRATLFSEDAYYWPMAHYGQPTSEEERAELVKKINYDDPSSKDARHMARDLSALKSGEPIDQPIYDYDQHDRITDVRTITPHR